MVMQAVHYSKQSQPALHTQADDRASVSTGAAKKGELLGLSSKNASGGPAQPATGVRQRRRRRHNPPPVTQSSADAVEV